MVKKLVFFLYIGDNLNPEEYMKKYSSVKLHFKLLKKYCNVFDESVFVLSLKKELLENRALIKEYMESIISLGFYNVRFKIEENTKFRESKAFNEEVIEKKENEGKLVFFTHSKGISNEYNDSLIKLICSMYYFNLNFMDEVEESLIGGERVYYGFPLMNSNWGVPEATYVVPIYKYYFYGTSFWTNYSVLYEIMEHKGRKFPTLSSRFYDENFPGNTIEFEMAECYKNTYALSGRNLHYDFDGFMDEYSEYAPDGPNIKKEFYSFVEKIKSEDF